MRGEKNIEPYCHFDLVLFDHSSWKGSHSINVFKLFSCITKHSVRKVVWALRLSQHVGLSYDTTLANFTPGSEFKCLQKPTRSRTKVKFRGKHNSRNSRHTGCNGGKSNWKLDLPNRPFTMANIWMKCEIVFFLGNNKDSNSQLFLKCFFFKLKKGPNNQSL